NLYDDGAHGDGAADDGVYASYFTNTNVEGSYTFDITATGTSPTSGVFSREAKKSTVVVPGPETITVIFPNGGETLTDMVTITWWGATDSKGHPVLYEIFYSYDGGSWGFISSDETGLSYEWDTTSVENGDYYLKVFAYCTEDMWSEDTSDGFFTVSNLEMTSIRSQSINPSTSITSSKSTPTINLNPGFSMVSLLVLSPINIILLYIYRRKH
ncbi:MAG: choice-of-anchor X domain-containing protein, partial [Candidatus Hodarchaeota archaeon]